MFSDQTLRLILLRHGNTFYSNEVPYQIGCRSDLDLTSMGNTQASVFANYLKKENILPHAIYCGPLKRHLQTASILHENFPLSSLWTHQKELDEIDYGEWEGLPSEKIKQGWPAEYSQWEKEAIYPSHIFGNSLQHYFDLLSQWLNRLKATVPNEACIVAVSSNGILRIFLQLFPSIKIQNSKVKTGHYCDFTFKGGSLVKVLWNCTP